MNGEHSRADEDMRVIRTLMERATICRAISASIAFLGGALSILSALFIWQSERFLGRAIRPREFAIVWIDVLVLTIIATAVFVWREAKSGGRLFLSPGMKLALRAIVPNLLVPAIFTVWFLQTGFLGAVELELVVIWVVFYGLALLSTALFAPRALAILGWAFLLTGAGVAVITNALEGLTDDAPNLVMGITFGLYHIIYALCTWLRKSRASHEQFADE
jgi:hypothetical protein